MARRRRQQRRRDAGEGEEVLDVLVGRRPSEEQASRCPWWLPAGACDCENSLPITNSVLCRLEGGELAAVLNSKYVLSVEPVGSISLLQSDDEPGVVSHAELELNLPWGLDRVNQRDLPLDANAEVDRGGSSGVHVYVLDSGIKREHNEFTLEDTAGRVLRRVVPGVSAVSETAEDRAKGLRYATDDCVNHGTHVAATIAGATMGVVHDAVIHPIRVVHCNGTGPTSALVAALGFVHSSLQRPAVVSMSLYARGSSVQVALAVAQLKKARVLSVAASGNGGDDACNYFPAGIRDVLTVGAVDSKDRRPEWSNYGKCVNIHAPGVDVLSACNSNRSCTEEKSGTSMATPHATGVVARMLAREPWLTAEAALTKMENMATKDAIPNPRRGTPNRVLYSDAGTISSCASVPAQTVADRDSSIRQKCSFGPYREEGWPVLPTPTSWPSLCSSECGEELSLCRSIAPDVVMSRWSHCECLQAFSVVDEFPGTLRIQDRLSQVCGSTKAEWDALAEGEARITDKCCKTIDSALATRCENALAEGYPARADFWRQRLLAVGEVCEAQRGDDPPITPTSLPTPRPSSTPDPTPRPSSTPEPTHRPPRRGCRVLRRRCSRNGQCCSGLCLPHQKRCASKRSHVTLGDPEE